MRKYNIGQYRYEKNKEYLAAIDINESNIGYEDNAESTIEGKVFKDLKIDYSLEKKEMYYLSCNLDVDKNGTVYEIYVKLKREDGSREQIIGNFTFLNKGEKEKNHIGLTFVPRVSFDKIVFELVRRSVDDSWSGEGPRKLTFYNNEVSLSRVKNIIEDEGFLQLKSNIFKLGIQGNSGLIFCLNGEPIRLGQSGMYEVYKDDFEIYSVGFIVNENNKDDIYFIMDYCYKEEEAKG